MDSANAVEEAALSQQTSMEDSTAQGDSDVQNFYEDSVIFITGGSGFLGKQLIEKLLRSCKISKIYVLLRPKKGKEVKDRLHDLIEDPLFHRLRQKNPNFSDKIIAIEGDVSQSRLGISDEHWITLTQEVDVIFYGAATIRFDEPLRAATLINVKGVKEALLFGRYCKKLKSYVHISTTYCHATFNRIGNETHEMFYDVPLSPNTLLSMVEEMDDNRLNSITNGLIKNWAQTYIFTKAMAEELIRTSSTGLPICIVRPSLVISSYREPFPGWCDTSCLRGGVGWILGVGIGAIRTLYMNPNVKLPFIPLDIVNNAIIVAARETAANQSRGGRDTKIYNITSTQRNPVKNCKIMTDTVNNGRKFRSPKSISYPFVIVAGNKFWFNLVFKFVHTIPAYLADFVCTLMGKPRRFVKFAKRFYNTSLSFAPGTLYEWNFVDNNIEKLFNNLSTKDKIIFNFDVTSIDWTEYLRIIFIGLRKYIIKDGFVHTENAKKKQSFLKYVYFVILALYGKCSWFLLYCVANFISKFL